MRQLPWRVGMAGLLATAITGCQEGPVLKTVTGTVQANGKPLPYAYVVFQPVSPPGTYGSAYTDQYGKYELQFSSSRKGAPVGTHAVTIRPARADELPEQGSSRPLLRLVDAAPLTREVAPRANVHDFDLKVTAETP